MNQVRLTYSCWFVISRSGHAGLQVSKCSDWFKSNHKSIVLPSLTHRHADRQLLTGNSTISSAIAVGSAGDTHAHTHTGNVKHIIDLAAYNRRSAILTPHNPVSHAHPAVNLLDSRSEVSHTWPAGRSELPSAIVYMYSRASRLIRLSLIHISEPTD